MSLLFTVKNPLYPAAKRLKIYSSLNIFILVLMVIWCIVFNTMGIKWIWNTKTMIGIFKFKRRTNEIFQYFLFYPLIVSPIIGVYAIWVAIYTLNKPGIG